MIPSSVYFTLCVSLSLPHSLRIQFFPARNNNTKYCPVPTPLMKCLSLSLVCVWKKKFVRFSIRSLSLILRMCVSMMPERKERKKNNIKTICLYGGLTFSVFLLYIIHFWAMCESFVYAGELDCIFFSGWWTQRATCDDEARSSEAKREK